MSSNSTGRSVPSDGPLSLDALFDAEVRRTDDEDITSPVDTAPAIGTGSLESPDSFDTPASSDSPEDPEDVDHEEDTFT